MWDFGFALCSKQQQQIKNKVKRVWFYLEFGDLCLNNGFIIEKEINIHIYIHCAYEVQIGVVDNKPGANYYIGKMFSFSMSTFCIS